MSHQKLKYLCLILLFSLNCYAKNNSNFADWKLSLRCLGPICVGMTIEQASKAARMNLEWQEAGTYAPLEKPITKYQELLKKPGHCFYVSTEELKKHAEFMVTNGRISRIELYSNKFHTLSGISINDSEEKLKNTYKNKITLDKKTKYHLGTTSNNFIFVSKDKIDQKYRLVFLVFDKKIAHIRTGYIPEVSQCEGCL